MHTRTHTQTRSESLSACADTAPAFVKLQYSIILFRVVSLKKSSVTFEYCMDGGKWVFVSRLRVSATAERELGSFVSIMRNFSAQ